VLRAVLWFWASRPLALALVAGLVATVVAFGGMAALSYMESPEFCGRCHTMDAQVQAHEFSAHESVECAECHVGDGLRGLIKSKMDGAQQTIKILTGTYAKPIPPAAHDMPPANTICLRCHDPARQAGDVLITRSNFAEDEGNTEQRTALVVRLTEDTDQDTEGIHWHVLSDVEYISPDEGQTVTWIGVDRPDGTHEEFIAENEVEVSSLAGQSATELKLLGEPRRMSCYDCHNRVGHNFVTPTRGLDTSMAEGIIDPELPFIKKWGLAAVERRYDSEEEAFTAINGLRSAYHEYYPWVFLERPIELAQSLNALAGIYRATSNPEMDGTASDYPSYMGHTDSAGCFRCHDGGHYRIDNGVLSDEPIPARCSTCHTFPSVGSNVPNVMVGDPPESHSDKLWVFEHKNIAESLEVNQTTCSSCHSQTYCSNCHNSGAASVDHDDMFYDHASVIESAGQQPCAYCHQRPFCVRCHESDKEKIFPSAEELSANHDP
jgi:nitrate/TMAO reductase-like tetraheme cytochrome c subunit